MPPGLITYLLQFVVLAFRELYLIPHNLHTFLCIHSQVCTVNTWNITLIHLRSSSSGIKSPHKPTILVLHMTIFQPHPTQVWSAPLDSYSGSHRLQLHCHHLTSSLLFCQRPQGDSSKISDSSSLSSSSSGEAAEVVEVTGGDTEVRPGAEEEDSTFGSEPLLTTVWDSPSDMLE